MSKRTLQQASAFSRSAESGRFTPALEPLEARNLMDASAFVRGLYADILHRSSPNDAEVSGWVSQIQAGVRKQDVAAAFVGSSEHRSVIVRDDYTKLLGRSADQPSLDFWAQQLASGMHEDRIEAAILGSQEYLEHHGNTSSSFVDAVYQDELHRGADDASRAFWVNQLANGVSRDSVSIGIGLSHEAHLRDVDNIYQEVLHRGADDNGRQTWANFLDNNGSSLQVTQLFCSSNEYFDDHGSDG